MEENKNIRVEIPKVSLPSIPEIGIKFLNGEVFIPAKYGAYVVASGCGSGKTTAIRKIILERHWEGIVYSAFTIEECNEMYRYLVEKGPEYGLEKENIVMFHSSYQDEGVDMNMLRSLSEDIKSKNVIICTHHKLLNEYPEVFLNYNRNSVNLRRLSHFARGKMTCNENGIKKYPRQLVIIDELPTCGGMKFEISKSDLMAIGVPVTRIVQDPVKLDFYHESTRDDGFVDMSNGGSYDILEGMYKTLGINKFPNNPLGMLKRDFYLSKIYENYDSYMRLVNDPANKSKSITVTCTLSDQIAGGDYSGETRYIIFDGTGDLTFKNSQVFNLISLDYKYSSPIEVSKIPIKYYRSYRSEEEFNNKFQSLINGIDKSIDNIEEIIKGCRGTLIVTWKNIKINGSVKKLPVLGINDNREVEYKDYISIKLGERGLIEGVDYSMIHYQSGLDKATNEFRDYESVIFLGEFHVPGYVISDFNRDYRVETDLLNYTTYQLVQAVCRTRIRNHRGESIRIYFTDDWSKEVIKNVIEYLGNSSQGRPVRDTTLDNIKPKWKNIAKLFSNLDPEFKRCLEYKSGPHRIEFTLDEIYDLVPLSEKKVKKYYPMINYFRKFGIEIIITSEKRGRFSSIPRYD